MYLTEVSFLEHRTAGRKGEKGRGWAANREELAWSLQKGELILDCGEE